MDIGLREIQHIIVRSIIGQVTGEEQEIVNQWRQENQAHECLYQKIHEASNLNRHMQELADIDINIELAFQRNQRLIRVITTRKIIRRYWPYAAAVLLFLGCFLLWPESVITPSEIVAQQGVVPGGQRAELILANGSSVQLVPGMESHLKVGTSDVTISGNGVHYSGEVNTSEIIYHTIRTPLGGEYSIVLADGSVVRLNALSELKYPVNFKGNERKVELKGEAYFEVKRDTNRPFLVMAEGKQVEVLGTVFNINVYQENPVIKTTLCSGSICFSDPQNQNTVILKPGEQVSYNKESGELSVVQVDTDLYTAWTEGAFRFDNTRIDEIFNTLQRWYRIEVIYANQQVKAEVFTGKLPRFDSLETILNLMEEVSSIKFEMKGNVLVVR